MASITVTIYYTPRAAWVSQAFEPKCPVPDAGLNVVCAVCLLHVLSYAAIHLHTHSIGAVVLLSAILLGTESVLDILAQHEAGHVGHHNGGICSAGG